MAENQDVTHLIDSALFDDIDISLLEKVKIQAQVLVPVLRAFRAELGEAKANEIANSALREWSLKVHREIGDQIPGSPRQKWEAITGAWQSRIGSEDADIEELNQAPEVHDFNITGCRYADFFRQLGEPELGATLLCELDRDWEAVGSPEVELQRTQTIMKGAKYCDFRYRMTTGGTK